MIHPGASTLKQLSTDYADYADWSKREIEALTRRSTSGLRRHVNADLRSQLAKTTRALRSLATTPRSRSWTNVFGSCSGAFAEYACGRESGLAMKPHNASFEQAASVPVAALTALQALRDKGQIQPGQKVLINGAAGGVGTFAVQIGKSFGAEVTGVCSTRNVEMVRSIGADKVIDYTREDFTSSGQHYDVIFDFVANHSFSERRRVLTPKGIYIGAGIMGRSMSLIGLLASGITE